MRYENIDSRDQAQLVVNSIENKDAKNKYEVNDGTELEHAGIKVDPTSSKRKVTFCDVVKSNLTTDIGDNLLVTKKEKLMKR